LGQKVHPIGFRLGVIKGWQSRWYASNKTYKTVLAEDIAIRAMIRDELSRQEARGGSRGPRDSINPGIARIEIERVAGTQIIVSIYTSKPGIVIGKDGKRVEDLRLKLEKLTKKKVNPKIQQIHDPNMEAVLVAERVAEQLEKRISFRRAMKQAVKDTMKSGAKGIKIICGGRLGGAEIARSEREVEGSVPLHTLRADIDFAVGVAKTTYGTIGIKVWIYRGDILPDRHRSLMTAAPDSQPRREGGQRRDDFRRRDDRGPRRDGGDRGGPRRDGGDRGGPRRDGGDRGGPPRPQGEYRPRPQGEGFSGPPRPQGEFRPRPQGDRPAGPPRPQGEFRPRPQSDRPAAGPVNPPSSGDTPAAPAPETPAKPEE
jgi:small subunit ribosomal protein S3